MRVSSLLFILVSVASGTSGVGPKQHKSTNRRDPFLVRRDAIVRSVFTQHPGWTSSEVFDAVQPRLALAGLRPISYPMLCTQLTAIRKDLKIPRTWAGMLPEHTDFLKREYANDPTQAASTVVTKFRAHWGFNAEKDDRVLRWWHNQVGYNRRKQVATTGPPRDASRVQLPMMEASGALMEWDLDLPADWWVMGQEFDKYVSSDSARTAACSDTHYTS